MSPAVRAAHRSRPLASTASIAPPSLRRAFHTDIETRGACGGPVRVIASIEDPTMIGKILAHVGEGQAPMPSLLVLRPEPRAPPEPEG